MKHMPVDTAADLNEQIKEIAKSISTLEALQSRAEQPAITPGEVAFRDPQDVYHHITIGAVLVAQGLSAHDARRLDGLLSLPVAEAARLLQEAADLDPAEEPTVGELLVAVLDRLADPLEAIGRFAEWRRGFERYRSRTEAYLAQLTPDQLADLKRKPVSQKQTEQVRRTCACFDIEFPALANRAEAFEWLWNAGANLSYIRITS